MIVERVLLSLRIPDGFVPAVRDCVLYSQIANLGGLAMLGRDCETLRQARTETPRLRTEGNLQVLNGANQHAWIVAPAVLDLALASARAGGRGEIVTENVAEPAELALLTGMAGRYGAMVDVNVSARTRLCSCDLGPHQRTGRGDESGAHPWNAGREGAVGAALCPLA